MGWDDDYIRSVARRDEMEGDAMADYAWHFCRSGPDGMPMMRDGRPVVVGEWVEHSGQAVLCASGLHASWRALEALRYCEWDNAWACLVEVDQIAEENAADKLVCMRRRVVAALDCDEVLRLFARQCALSVIHLWPTAPAVCREYLETGNEEIRAAAGAAAARAAAAWAAAWAAAGAAAARAAAAWAAAWAAAGAAASWDAAARAAAAWDAAAWAAAWAATADLLESLLLGAMAEDGLIDEGEL